MLVRILWNLRQPHHTAPQQARQAWCRQSAARRHYSLACAASSAGQTACGRDSVQVFKVTPDDVPAGRQRLDAYLALKLAPASRARVQASIRAGLVAVNGGAIRKPGADIRLGDSVTASLPDPPTIEALPEVIPLDIVFEDEHLLVVNKPAGMVVHPAPGHYSGTLVNALLAHCKLPAAQLAVLAPAKTLFDQKCTAELQRAMKVGCSAAVEAALDGDEDEAHVEMEGEDADCDGTLSLWAADGSVAIRPGIVHRLDKGTTGLLVVAKDEVSLAALGGQFKSRTVGRTYWSVTLGVPQPCTDDVRSNVGRDPRDRKRMAAHPYGGSRGKPAHSVYKTLRPLAGGTAALVEWQLRTGRTHQIRVHAKQVSNPLLGDVTYGGSPGAALARSPKGLSKRQLAQLADVVGAFGRPALHAKTLAFDHPVTDQRLEFDSQLPPDMVQLLMQLDMLATDGLSNDI